MFLSLNENCWCLSNFGGSNKQLSQLYVLTNLLVLVELKDAQFYLLKDWFSSSPTLKESKGDNAA